MAEISAQPLMLEIGADSVCLVHFQKQT